MTKAYEIGGPAAQSALITPIFRAYYEDDLDISDPDVPCRRGGASSDNVQG